MKTRNNWQTVTFANTTCLLLAAAFYSLTGSLQAAKPRNRHAQPQVTAPQTTTGITADLAAAEENNKRQKLKVNDAAPAALRPKTGSPSPNAITSATYAFTSTTGAALDDMSFGTTVLIGSSMDDNASTVADIGFDFWFDGVRYSQFSVNSNGLLRLETITDTSPKNALAAGTAPDPKISAYWDDIATSATGKVHYKVTGFAPTRKLTVEYLNMSIPSSIGQVGGGTWQLSLVESTGQIEFVYGSGIETATNGYSVGLGNSSASFASVATSDNSVSYAAENSTQLDAITSGTKYSFTPNIPDNPGALSFTDVG